MAFFRFSVGKRINICCNVWGWWNPLDCGKLLNQQCGFYDQVDDELEEGKDMYSRGR